MPWVIDQNNELHKQWREELGDAEFERRLRVAAEKRDAYPEDAWQEKTVFGNQFEPIAMQCSQHVFDQLENRSYAFWQCLVQRLASK